MKKHERDELSLEDLYPVSGGLTIIGSPTGPSPKEEDAEAREEGTPLARVTRYSAGDRPPQVRTP